MIAERDDLPCATRGARAPLLQKLVVSYVGRLEDPAIRIRMATLDIFNDDDLARGLWHKRGAKNLSLGPSREHPEPVTEPQQPWLYEAARKTDQTAFRRRSFITNMMLRT